MLRRATIFLATVLMCFGARAQRQPTLMDFGLRSPLLPKDRPAIDSARFGRVALPDLSTKEYRSGMPNLLMDEEARQDMPNFYRKEDDHTRIFQRQDLREFVVPL